jgi:hypothetical protein
LFREPIPDHCLPIATLVVPALERSGQEIKLGQDVAEMGRQHFCRFKPPPRLSSARSTVSAQADA